MQISFLTPFPPLFREVGIIGVGDVQTEACRCHVPEPQLCLGLGGLAARVPHVGARGTEPRGTLSTAAAASKGSGAAVKQAGDLANPLLGLFALNSPAKKAQAAETAGHPWGTRLPATAAAEPSRHLRPPSPLPLSVAQQKGFQAPAAHLMASFRNPWSPGQGGGRRRRRRRRQRQGLGDCAAAMRQGCGQGQE